jgi:hypothetical protein
MFITMFTRARYWTIFWAQWSSPCSPALFLQVSSLFYPSVYTHVFRMFFYLYVPHRKFRVHFNISVCATDSAYFILFYLFPMIMCGVQYKLLLCASPVFCYLLPLVLGPYIPSALWFQTPTVYVLALRENQFDTFTLLNKKKRNYNKFTV